MTPLSQTLLGLFRASRELAITQFQSAALDSIQQLLYFDFCVWTTSRVTSGGCVHHTVHLHPVPRGATDGQEPTRKVMDSVVGTLQSYAASFPCGPDAPQTDIHLRRIGKLNCLLSAHLHRDTGVVHGVAFCRGYPIERFSLRDKRASRQLVPHLVEALTTNRAYCLERLEAQQGGGGYRVLAIADREGNLYYLDEDFAALIQNAHAGWQTRLPLRPYLDALFDEYGEARFGCTIGLERLIANDTLILRTRARMCLDNLTPRQLIVARYAAEGLSHKEIARRLIVAPATVRNHIQAIHRKLDVHNSAELAGRLKLADVGTLQK